MGSISYLLKDLHQPRMQSWTLFCLSYLQEHFPGCKRTAKKYNRMWLNVEGRWIETRRTYMSTRIPTAGTFKEVPQSCHNFQIVTIIISKVAVDNGFFVGQDYLDILIAKFLPPNLGVPHFFCFPELLSGYSLLFCQSIHLFEFGCLTFIHFQRRTVRSKTLQETIAQRTRFTNG